MQTLRIREVRKQKSISLRHLAQKAKVSPGLISQVERGLTQPSLDTLRQIARALEVPLFSLLDAAEESACVVRADRRMVVSSPTGVQYQRLSPGFGKLELLEGFLPAGGSSVAEKWSHPSEECVLVLEGRLQVQVADDTYDIGAGDSCYFDSRLPHAYCNPTREPVRFIVAITPPSY